jgi:hypothetical protein
VTSAIPTSITVIVVLDIYVTSAQSVQFVATTIVVQILWKIASTVQKGTFGAAIQSYVGAAFIRSVENVNLLWIISERIYVGIVGVKFVFV